VGLPADPLRDQRPGLHRRHRSRDRPRPGEAEAHHPRRPPPEIRALRVLARTRLQLVRDRTREWQRLEKLLEGALVKLSSVVSSLAGTKTARDILEAVAGGEADPRALAALAHGNVKGGRAAVERSLQGMQVRACHRLLIRAHLDHVAWLDRTIPVLEDEIEAALDAIETGWGVTADGVPDPGPGPGPGAAVLPATARLAEIPGISPALARAIIAETGLRARKIRSHLRQLQALGLHVELTDAAA
jgi:transposase